MLLCDSFIYLFILKKMLLCDEASFVYLFIYFLRKSYFLCILTDFIIHAFPVYFFYIRVIRKDYLYDLVIIIKVNKYFLIFLL